MIELKIIQLIALCFSCFSLGASLMGLLYSILR